eukprot:gene6078-5940_t
MTEIPNNPNEYPLLKNQLDLATLVRTHRLQAGAKGGKMTAQTLAELAGVSRDTVFRIERGEDVSFSTAMAVLRVFGLGLSAAPVEWPTLNTAQQHFKAHIARASDGRSVVAWAEEGFIYLQRVNADGTLNGMRINGNALGTGTVRDLQVAMDNSANFAIIYTKGFAQDAKTYFRRFNADGSPETQHDGTAKDFISQVDVQEGNSVVQEADGDYAVIMSTSTTWIGQRYSAAGVAGSVFTNGFYLNDYDATTPIAVSKRLASNDYEFLYNRDDDRTEPDNALRVVRYGGPEGTPKLTMQLSKNPIVAGMGDQIILRWLSNVVGPFSNGTCQATGNWGGFVAPSGTRDLGFFTVAGDRTYGLICGQNAQGLVQEVTLNVQGTNQPLPTPTVSLTVSPTSITSGSAAQINWSTTNATTCEASGAWSGTKATSGSESTGTLTNPGTLTYTLTCRNQGGPTATQSAELQVQADTTPNLIVGGSYSINGGAYTATNGTISNGNTLRLRTTANNTPGATSTATVNVGGFEAVFTSTTRMPDNASTAMVEDTGNNPVQFMSNEGTITNLRS